VIDDSLANQVKEVLDKHGAVQIAKRYELHCAVNCTASRCFPSVGELRLALCGWRKIKGDERTARGG